MTASPAQIDFIRKHGITHCPPGPEIAMVWGTMRKKHQVRELSEQDSIRLLCASQTFLTRWETAEASRHRKAEKEAISQIRKYGRSQADARLALRLHREARAKGN
jgi:hypothetical protein